ncbi:hypothetical protein [Draconibacterium sediminis]|uniref:Uncharacterized protein n=1 Tax=Draconibacterium sediminis TaxID=1544798 RepID=A0A0D8JD33_9BACT|nr:hypothetical protein [Draconibacterium sediminis]KJF44880.1 hypothetical protein LH29_05450 [Draconibacterium sediminis]
MMLIIRLNCRNHRSDYSNIEICGQKKQAEKNNALERALPMLMYNDLSTESADSKMKLDTTKRGTTAAKESTSRKVLTKPLLAEIKRNFSNRFQYT